jgi:hypothetical protein
LADQGQTGAGRIGSPSFSTRPSRRCRRAARQGHDLEPGEPPMTSRLVPPRRGRLVDPMASRERVAELGAHAKGMPSWTLAPGRPLALRDEEWRRPGLRLESGRRDPPDPRGRAATRAPPPAPAVPRARLAPPVGDLARGGAPALTEGTTAAQVLPSRASGGLGGSAPVSPAPPDDRRGHVSPRGQGVHQAIVVQRCAAHSGVSVAPEQR